jgi:hypothetical protein
MSPALLATLQCWPQLLILGACIIHVYQVIQATGIVRLAFIAAGQPTGGVYLFCLKEFAKVAVAQFIMYSGGFWDPLIRIL